MKRATEIATIDVALVTISTNDSETEIGLDTASKIEVEPQIETNESIKLIVKGVLKAQKPESSTLTGNQITLTDNVFTPELVMLLQGGTLKYWSDEDHTSMQDTPTDYGIAQYAPPVSGSNVIGGKSFVLSAYSAQYDSAGNIIQYEKISYPNCKGVPVAFGSEDDVFRVAEYTINSAPEKDEPPYIINYVDMLPILS